MCCSQHWCCKNGKLLQRYTATAAAAAAAATATAAANAANTAAIAVAAAAAAPCRSCLVQTTLALLVTTNLKVLAALQDSTAQHLSLP